MAVLLLPPMSAHSSAHFQTYSYFYSTNIFDYYEQLVGGLWPAYCLPVMLRLGALALALLPHLLCNLPLILLDWLVVERPNRRPSSTGPGTS